MSDDDLKPWEMYQQQAAREREAAPPAAPDLRAPAENYQVPFTGAVADTPQPTFQGAYYSPAESFLQGAGQGATYNFADEAGAGVRAALDIIEQGEARSPLPYAGVRRLFDVAIDGGDELPSFSEHYRAKLEQQREYMRRTRRANPGTFFAGELFGGLGQGGPGAAKVAGGRTFAQALPRVAGTGAVMGGTAGVGASEATINDPLLLAMDGGSGALIGGLVSTALPVAGSLGKKATKLFRGASTEEMAARLVMDDLTAAGLTTDQAVEMLRENPSMVLGDLGVELQRLTSDIANAPGGTASEMVKRFLENRNIAQIDRILPAVSRALGGASRNYRQVAVELGDQFRSRADDLYRRAYRTPVRLNTKLVRLWDTPAGKDALEMADRVSQQTRQKMPPGQYNMMRMDLGVRALDDKISQLYKDGLGTEAAAVRETRDQIKKLLFKQNPAYRRAREVWSGGRADENAMELGLKSLRDDADNVSHMLQGMSESERMYFRVGAMRAIQRKIGGAGSDAGDVVKKLRSGYNQRQVLRVLFPNRREYDAFLNMLDSESRMFETYSGALSNSLTHQRAQKAGQVGEEMGLLASVALGQKMGLPVAGFPFVGRKIGRRAGERVARRLTDIRDTAAPMLLSRDPATIRGLENVARGPVQYPSHLPFGRGRYGGLTPTAGLTGANLLPGLLED